jgi:pyrroloquinoline quinone (PQQ) biosynthesis protein C
VSDPTPPAGESASSRRKRRPKRLRASRPPQLTVTQILAWADDHYERTGRWPKTSSGSIRVDLNEKWHNVDASLHQGNRGLPGGSSLAKLLAEHRRVRNPGALPPLTERQILVWADTWHARTGQWPHTDSRQEVPEAPGERWYCIDQALRGGGRGLPGGDTLARLLARERGARNLQDLPPLTEKQILRWCKNHHHRTGSWPTIASGQVEDATGESWFAVNTALRDGGRGLPGGSSLAQVMAKRLGLRNKASIPRLTAGQILRWADAHKRKAGQWPRVQSGALADVHGETWLAIDLALREGLRGLPGGDSLPRLLARKRGARNKAASPPLNEALILRWADDHHQRFGKWPKQTSGPVLAAPGETWGAIQRSLSTGQRGLPGGDSLARLFERRRNVRSQASAPRLTEAMILEWSEEHYRRTGHWPKQDSGAVARAPRETWGAIQDALRVGRRGLAGGDSIVRLLARHGRDW